MTHIKSKTIIEVVAHLIYNAHYVHGQRTLPSGLVLRLTQPMPNPKIELMRLNAFATPDEVALIRDALEVILICPHIEEVTSFVEYSDDRGRFHRRYGVITLIPAPTTEAQE